MSLLHLCMLPAVEAKVKLTSGEHCRSRAGWLSGIVDGVVLTC